MALAHHRRHEEAYPTINQKEYPPVEVMVGERSKNEAEAEEANCDEIATGEKVCCLVS